jgi:hypothetical protein
MPPLLHLTSGDCAGERLAKSGISGEVFVWHDLLYDGPRNPGWPSETTLDARARFLEDVTGGGLSRDFVLQTLKAQYRKLETVPEHGGLVLWFDACLLDQSMLCHVLTCLKSRGIEEAELLCVADFPGVAPYHGLGQLTPAQLASVYDRRGPVTDEQFRFAEAVDRAFALQDPVAFVTLANLRGAPLPWVPAAVARWREERPDPEPGLGRLERMAVEAVRAGARTPAEVFRAVSEAETPPQYWGDVTLWAKLNRLASRTPPLVRIEGPRPLLPVWGGEAELPLFRVEPG